MAGSQCVEDRGLTTLGQADNCDVHTRIINLVVFRKERLITLEQLTPFSLEGGLDTAAAFGLEPVSVVVQVGRQKGPAHDRTTQ